MGEIIQMKDKRNLGIEKIQFINKLGKIVDELEEKRLRDLIYNCVAEKDYEFDFYTLCHINYESVEILKEKTNNKPTVAVFDVSNAIEMQVVVDTIHTRDYFCILEGRPDASLQEIMMDKYFTQFYCVGIRVNTDLKKPFRLNIFYKPIIKEDYNG